MRKQILTLKNMFFGFDMVGKYKLTDTPTYILTDYIVGHGSAIL